MKHRFHILLLLIWLIIGIAMRFIQLELLPPWTDECATIVFSLGNSFRTVPLDQIISSDTLLEPLRLNPNLGFGAVFNNLFSESTHPPIYFALTHLWMKLFSSPNEIISIWIARSLSAVLGVASIPAMFGFSYLVFRSFTVAHIAAATVAVSPYNVFLAREARHYTLTILLAIASLSFLIKALEVIYKRKVLPLWIGFTWIIVNVTGMATHYFFSLTLCVEGFVLLWEIWRQNYQNLIKTHENSSISEKELTPKRLEFKFIKNRLKIRRIFENFRKNIFAILPQPNQQRIWLVLFATLAGCLVWLPFLKYIQGSRLTSWVSNGTSSIIEPLWRLLMWVISMFYIIPSATILLPLWVGILSGAVMLLFLLWVLPYIKDGFKFAKNDSHVVSLANEHRSSQTSSMHGGVTITKALWTYLSCSIVLFLVFTYVLDIDLTLAPRFQFVYFPILILLVASSLAANWQSVNKSSFTYRIIPRVNGKVIVVAVWLMGFIGGITVVNNIGYLQHHRPDMMAPIIKQASQVPVIIATSHKHHGQTGRMMGLAWEMRKLIEDSSDKTWKFFLAHKDEKTQTYEKSVAILQNQITIFPRPFDLWLVNFRTGIDLNSAQCVPDKQYSSTAGEYKYKLYHCEETKA